MLFDGIEPWMSDKDIDSGARGLSDIETMLAKCSYGIIVVTNENQTSAWINFEAGALSKTLENESRVIPLLVGLTYSQLVGPLAQFQARDLDKDGMARIVDTLAKAVDVDPQVAEQRFNQSWPTLEKDVHEARERAEANTTAPKRSEYDLLEEVLGQVRDISRSVDRMPGSSDDRIAAALKDIDSLLSKTDARNSGSDAISSLDKAIRHRFMRIGALLAPEDERYSDKAVEPARRTSESRQEYLAKVKKETKCQQISDRAGSPCSIFCQDQT